MAGALWGGTPDDLALDISNATARLRIRRMEAGVAAVHELALSGLEDFRFQNQVPIPWDYAEVTAVRSGGRFR